MTAINLLCMPDAVHLFTDAGHFLNDADLVALGGKAIPLPRWNAVAVFHGPSLGGPALAQLMEHGSGSWEETLTSAVASIERSGALGGRPFSAILAGHDGQKPFGMAIEEHGKVHRLGIGSLIKALPCDASFDLADIESSGVRMMEEQRQRYGVVAGWCDYTRIGPRGVEGPRQLRRWSDVILSGTGPMSSAKIGELEVDTIKIDYNAVTGVATGTSSVVASNSAALPVQIFWHVDVDIEPGITWSASIVIDVKRSRGSVSYYHRTGHWSGSSGASFSVNGAVLDTSAAAGDTYTFSTDETTSGQGASTTFSNKKLTAIWVKK